MHETAALRAQIAVSGREEDDAMHIQSVQAVINVFPATKQCAIMLLLPCGQELEADNGGGRTPHGIYQTNCFLLVHGQGDVQDGALFLSIACMNHSWCPNVNHICQWDLQKTLVFASRDVVAIVGDELLPTYGPPSQWLNTEGGHAN
ncbi:SET domain-containing protein [Fragilaria crotonensis]|nr:SET domain-containing protein [Fragilaria crotonensis]